jgi:hypothetical protein
MAAWFTVVVPHTRIGPGGAYYTFSVGQYDAQPNWMAFGYQREFLRGGTTDVPGRPLVSPGVITIEYGAPGAQQPP